MVDRPYSFRHVRRPVVDTPRNSGNGLERKTSPYVIQKGSQLPRSRLPNKSSLIRYIKKMNEDRKEYIED